MRQHKAGQHRGLLPLAPSIALGWDRGGFHPPRLNAARLGKVAQAEAYEGDEILFLKWVPNFNDDHDGADGDTSSPLRGPS